MSKPNNSLANIRLPGDASNVKRPIVPYYVGVSENNNYVATLPTLESDDTIVTTNTAQTITGKKAFNYYPIAANGGLTTDNENITFSVTDTRDSGYDILDGLSVSANYDDNDNYIGTHVIAPGHFTAFGDDDNADTNKPDDETGFGDLDTDYFNTGITLRGDEIYKLSFPAKSGVFATVEDTQIPIEDLTQINS